MGWVWVCVVVPRWRCRHRTKTVYCIINETPVKCKKRRMKSIGVLCRAILSSSPSNRCRDHQRQKVFFVKKEKLIPRASWNVPNQRKIYRLHTSPSLFFFSVVHVAVLPSPATSFTLYVFRISRWVLFFLSFLFHSRAHWIICLLTFLMHAISLDEKWYL